MKKVARELSFCGDCHHFCHQSFDRLYDQLALVTSDQRVYKLSFHYLCLKACKLYFGSAEALDHLFHITMVQSQFPNVNDFLVLLKILLDPLA